MFILQCGPFRMTLVVLSRWHVYLAQSSAMFSLLCGTVRMILVVLSRWDVYLANLALGQ